MAAAASPWTPYASFLPTSLWDSSLLLMSVGVGPSSRQGACLGHILYVRGDISPRTALSGSPFGTHVFSSDVVDLPVWGPRPIVWFWAFAPTKPMLSALLKNILFFIFFIFKVWLPWGLYKYFYKYPLILWLPSWCAIILIFLIQTINEMTLIPQDLLKMTQPT